MHDAKTACQDIKLISIIRIITITTIISNLTPNKLEFVVVADVVR